MIEFFSLSVQPLKKVIDTRHNSTVNSYNFKVCNLLITTAATNFQKRTF